MAKPYRAVEAICRFVTGLLDSEQDKQYKQSMYEKAKELDLPASLVELRHEAIHGDMPSLVVLREGATKSFDWLKNDYWKYLPSEDGLGESDAPPFYNGRAALRNELRDTLQSYLSSCQDLKRFSQDHDVDVFAEAATETTSKIVGTCDGSKRALLELVDMLVHQQMLIPDPNHQLGDLAFPVWDPLLKKLAIRQSGFLQMLSYELTKQLITTPEVNPVVEDLKEAIVTWLEHMYTARDWDKAFKQGDLDDLHMVSMCLQTPNQWTTRLATSIVRCPERVRAQQMFGERITRAADDKGKKGIEAEKAEGWVAIEGENEFDGWQRSKINSSSNPVGVLWRRSSNYW
ncbi:MAG: hypothetical protein Q9218_005386 [Villophora microphyllina]